MLPGLQTYSFHLYGMGMNPGEFHGR